MALPSVTLLARAVRDTASRFPLSVVAAVVAAVSSGALVEDVGSKEFFVSLLVAGSLGIPLFLALDLLAERVGAVGARRTALWMVGLVVLAGLAIVWPSWTGPVQGRRYLQLSLGVHALVAVLPFLRRAELRGFWEYNIRLLGRALVATVYAGLVFGGLALAIGALDELFGVPIPETTYAHVWFAAAFVFGSVFFLAGVPTDFADLEARVEYPRWLKAFTQYMLMPIVVVYLAILTAYLAKVLVTTEWPSGWIGYLVSCAAVVGILSVLLVHPIATRTEHQWVAPYTRGFYIALVPAIVMLLLSIGKRIGQYGVTENRYFLVALSLWLAGIALYYGVTRSRDIRWIPTSLGALALLTLMGPWSAYAWSERSQVGRLRDLFEANGMWQTGGVQPAGASLSTADEREMSAILDYLGSTHGREAVAGWFADTVHLNGGTEAILASVGVSYVSWRGSGGGYRRLDYTADTPFAFDTMDDGRSFVFSAWRLDSLDFGGGITLVSDSLARTIVLIEEDTPAFVFSLDTLVTLVDAAQRDTTSPPVVLTVEEGGRRASLVVESISGRIHDGEAVSLRSLRGLLLVGGG